MRGTIHVKATDGIAEIGIGSIEAALTWESYPDEYGAFAHLARTPDGRWWISFTDMENHHGSYTSVEVTADDLASLRRVLESTEATR